MQLRVGPIPPNAAFQPEQGGWHPLREPGPVVLQLLAAPVSVLTGAGLFAAVLWLGLTNGSGVPSWVYGLVVVAIIPVHEMLHAWTHPGHGRSAASIIGVWPARALFYAHYDDVLRRDRFVAILLMPFLILSLLPPAVAAAVRYDGAWVGVLSVVNGVFSCGDFVGVVLVLSQVPRGGIVRNQGYYTWWAMSRAGDAA